MKRILCLILLALSGTAAAQSCEAEVARADLDTSKIDLTLISGGSSGKKRRSKTTTQTGSKTKRKLTAKEIDDAMKTPVKQEKPAAKRRSKAQPASAATSSENEAPMSSEPISETADADSRETVIHKEEGFDFKFSENPIVAWFLRGNPLLKTGIVVLFLGLAFLLRYASERVHIPIGLRYLSVAGGGLAALGARRAGRAALPVVAGEARPHPQPARYRRGSGTVCRVRVRRPQPGAGRRRGRMGRAQ